MRHCVIFVCVSIVLYSPESLNIYVLSSQYQVSKGRVLPWWQTSLDAYSSYHFYRMGGNYSRGMYKQHDCCKHVWGMYKQHDCCKPVWGMYKQHDCCKHVCVVIQITNFFKCRNINHEHVHMMVISVCNIISIAKCWYIYQWVHFLGT